MKLLEGAQKRKETAMLILEELKLLNKWNTIGQAFVVGATAYDLLVDHDIDIEIFCTHPNAAEAMAILADLTSNKKVLELKYRNYLKTPFNGIYFKIQYEQMPSEIWNIDMWLFSETRDGPLSRDLVSLMNDALTNESQNIILTIKEELLKKSLVLPSIYVYEAVLDYDIQCTEEFLNWIEQQDVDIQTNWRPSKK
ncbi:hypothetical protein B1B04_08720 [Lysinibacillus sp. KCTC 33748]|uniref:hypothetical protein n=1 Tax=unclassified Lysinibacillus TaxID=2636778 RepID=UPI0009A841C3|nr:MULTISPECIES: hypothetical protein [unclassified Lysinibacillus]OXS74956.1 hypothetical protein B1B04_08720 [Lysinibacillus sp. KCTC 33748]SKB60713.1 hypothetical protein SAMN06295926_104228 [Lysinibacillus sp. AC-3]